MRVEKPAKNRAAQLLVRLAFALLLIGGLGYGLYEWLYAPGNPGTQHADADSTRNAASGTAHPTAIQLRNFRKGMAVSEEELVGKFFYGTISGDSAKTVSLRFVEVLRQGRDVGLYYKLNVNGVEYKTEGEGLLIGQGGLINSRHFNHLVVNKHNDKLYLQSADPDAVPQWKLEEVLQ